MNYKLNKYAGPFPTEAQRLRSWIDAQQKDLLMSKLLRGGLAGGGISALYTLLTPGRGRDFVRFLRNLLLGGGIGAGLGFMSGRGALGDFAPSGTEPLSGMIRSMVPPKKMVSERGIKDFLAGLIGLGGTPATRTTKALEDSIEQLSKRTGLHRARITDALRRMDPTLLNYYIGGIRPGYHTPYHPKRWKAEVTSQSMRSALDELLDRYKTRQLPEVPI